MVLDDAQVLEVDTLKASGSEYFKTNKVEDALRTYTEALAKVKAMNYTNSKHQPELLQRVATVKDQLHVNAALCCVKLGKFEEAIDNASLALSSTCAELHEEKRYQETKLHVKALYLRGKAHAALDTYTHLDVAKRDLLKAIKMTPKDKLIRKELDGVMKRLQVMDEMEKEKRKKKQGFLKTAQAKGGAGERVFQDSGREKEQAVKKKEKFDETVAMEKYNMEREEQEERRKEKAKQKAIKDIKKAKAAAATSSTDYSRFDCLDTDSDESEDEEDVKPPAHVMKGRPKESSIRSMEVPQEETESDDDDIECTFGT
jgi:tetratricopeptide (TPR) repeat protein